MDIRNSNFDFVCAGSPLPPQNIRQTTTLGQDNYTVVIEWNTPFYNGGAPVDFYTVKSNTSEEVTVNLRYTFILTNNSVVSVSITTHNCAGDSDPVTLHIEKCNVLSIKIQEMQFIICVS